MHRRVVKCHIKTDGKTVWTHFIYDASNQIVEERETDAREKSPLIASRQYVWDDDGRLASMIVGKP